MNCQELQAELSAYVDGELGAASRGALEAHLGACAACRQHLSELQRLSQGLAELPNSSIPPAFLVEVKRKLARRDPWWHAAWWLSPGWVKVPLQAAAVLIVLSVVVFLHRVPARSLVATSKEPAARETAKAKAGPLVVLEEADQTTTLRATADAGSAVPAAPAGEPKQWAVADRLREPETLEPDKLAGSNPPERKRMERLGTGPRATKTVDSTSEKKLTTPAIIVVSAQPALVQDAAMQVAQRLSGLATRLQTTPDGAMSFLHVEVPATRVAEFRSLFDRQCAVLNDKYLTAAKGSTLAAAAPAVPAGKMEEPARLADGIAEMRHESLSRSDKEGEGVAAAKKLAFGMAGGRTATNLQPDIHPPTEGEVMVILEIQIKIPSTK